MGHDSIKWTPNSCCQVNVFLFFFKQTGYHAYIPLDILQFQTKAGIVSELLEGSLYETRFEHGVLYSVIVLGYIMQYL